MLWRLGGALSLWATVALAEPLTFVRALPLSSDAAGFGGLSAIETRDGQSALVLSDRGAAFRLRIDRMAGTVDITPATQPHPGRDSEGLAWAGGNLFFSYEGPASVARATGEVLRAPPAFAALPPNSGIEALAGMPDGTVLALPERSGALDRPFPVYAWRHGQWSEVAALPRVGPFLPTGADLGPDGALYVLERAFTPLGFRTRIRRLALDRAAEAEVLLTTYGARHGNLEGLAIWVSRSGATCLSMVSDDNFLSVLPTELVEYALTKTLAGDARCD